MILLLFLFCCTPGIKYTLADNSIEKRVKEIEAAILINPDSGIEKSNQFLAFGLQQQNEEVVAEAYFQLGQGNFYKGRINLSNEYLKKALKLDYTKSNLSFLGKCLKWQGVNYDFLGDDNQALLSYQDALGAFEKGRDSSGIAQVWISMGMLEMKLLHFEPSESYFRKALNYFEPGNDIPNTYGLYQNLALLYQRQMQYDKALGYMFRVLDKYRSENMRLGTAQMLFNIASLYEEHSDKEKAKEYFDAALIEAKAINASDIIVNINIRLSNLKPTSSDVKIKLLKNANELYTREGNFQKLEEIYSTQLNQFAKSGDIKSYESALVDFQEVQKKLAEKRHAEKYEELKAVYEFEKKEDLIKIQEGKIETKNVLLICAVGLILILITVAFIYGRMYFRVKSYAKSLFRMNQELLLAGVLQTSLIGETESSDLPQEQFEEEVQVDISEEQSEGNKLKELYEEIIHQIEKEKLYIRNDLAVADLSRIVNSNDKYISQAINTYSGGNFSSLINAYRINEARRLIKEHGKELTIKELADHSGFNSLNTFYKKFKEATGLTPSMYIEIAVESSI